MLNFSTLISLGSKGCTAELDMIGLIKPVCEDCLLKFDSSLVSVTHLVIGLHHLSIALETPFLGLDTGPGFQCV